MNDSPHPLNYFSYCPRCGSNSFAINNEKSKRCDLCGFVYYINPSAATAAFILNQEGELLVCIRSKEPKKGAFDLPGGFADLNETIETSMEREIGEELGVIPNSIKYLFSIPNRYEYSGMIIPTMDFFFEVGVSDLAPLQAADDVAEVRWIPVEHLDPEQFGFQSMRIAVRRWIDMQCNR